MTALPFGGKTAVLAPAPALARERKQFDIFLDFGIMAALLVVAHGLVLIPGLVLTALFIGTILLARFQVGWFPTPPAQLREGERTLVEQFGSGVPRMQTLPSGQAK